MSALSIIGTSLAVSGVLVATFRVTGVQNATTRVRVFAAVVFFVLACLAVGVFIGYSNSPYGAVDVGLLAASGSSFALAMLSAFSERLTAPDDTTER